MRYAVQSFSRSVTETSTGLALAGRENQAAVRPWQVSTKTGYRRAAIVIKPFLSRRKAPRLCPDVRIAGRAPRGPMEHGTPLSARQKSSLHQNYCRREGTPRFQNHAKCLGRLPIKPQTIIMGL